MRSGIFFSHRLAGWLGTTLFLTSAAFAFLSLAGALGGWTPLLFLLVPGLIAHALIGTLGWSRILKRRSILAVQRYFAGQYLLFVALMCLELSVGTYRAGLSTTILGFGLIFQSSVLSRRLRLLFAGGILLIMTPLYSLSLDTRLDDSRAMLTYAGLFAVVYGAALFLGLLIVHEEAARETSRRLDESNRKLVQYAAEVEMLSAERERNRLAREIHDNLGHYLTAVNIQLEVAMMAYDRDQAAALPAMQKAQTLTKEALSEIRRSIHALRASPVEGRPLHEAIALLVEEHHAAGHAARYEVIGAMRPTADAVEMTLYRAAQEALTNIRKHAQAQSACVKLTYGDSGTMLLEISDDGAGADSTGQGFGLLGMRERVQLLGGALTIKTANGQGFKLAISLPA